MCAAQQSQLAMAHVSPGDAPQVDASLNGSAIHAPQPVRVCYNLLSADAFASTVPRIKTALRRLQTMQCESCS